MKRVDIFSKNIIRIRTMSTKTCLPSCLSVDIGPTIPLLVSSFDTCSLSPMQPLVLLLDVDISRLIIYYTDMHYVDEDMSAISNQGGYQAHGKPAGIAYRNLSISPSFGDPYVASSNMKNSQIIRIGLMSTKTG